MATEFMGRGVFGQVIACGQQWDGINQSASTSQFQNMEHMR
jgi:hypothetical protein